jgi:hypothetical protein
MCNFFQLVVILTLLQSINIVESPRLRKIFLLLRKELKESDIPSRSTMRTRIEQAYDEHMKQLEEEMAVN